MGHSYTVGIIIVDGGNVINNCDMGSEFWGGRSKFKSVSGLKLQAFSFSVYWSGLWEVYSNAELRCGSK